MAEKTKQPVKLNKNHKGKEFRSFFHFIGKVSPIRKQIDGEWTDLPLYDTTLTKTTKKPRRVLQFNLETAKDNQLKIENAGMEFDWAYLYSQTEESSQSIKWEDRFNKKKYPNETYHLMDTDWDLVEKLSENVEVDKFVEVKGHYEFDSFINSDNETINLVKRIVTEINPVEEGQEVKAGKDTFNYVTDFESPEFREVNYMSMQIGINSIYQKDDANNQDVFVNAYFLDYGKERSTPHDVQLKVPYKKPEEGKKSLSEAFQNLNRLDFVEVNGKDLNTVLYGEAEAVEEKDDDPFADISENDKVKRTKRTIIGTRKGLEIHGIVQGSWISEFLTEDEVKKVEKKNPFNSKDSNKQKDDDPFADVGDDSDPFAE